MQHARGSRLFGTATTAPLTPRRPLLTGNRALDDEALLMLFAGNVEDRIGGKLELARLQILLQSGLGIFLLGRAGQPLDFSLIEPQNHRACRRESGIQVDGAEQCFERVGVAPVQIDRILP